MGTQRTSFHSLASKVHSLLSEKAHCRFSVITKRPAAPQPSHKSQLVAKCSGDALKSSVVLCAAQSRCHMAVAVIGIRQQHLELPVAFT